MKKLLWILLILPLLANAATTILYVSPQACCGDFLPSGQTAGNVNNSGADTNHPTTLAYALNVLLVNDCDIEMMDGLYNAGQQQTYNPKGEYQFHKTSATHILIHAINKWKAIVAYGTTSGIEAATGTGYLTDYVTFDGLQTCSNQVNGVSVCRFSAVRNCWVHDNSQQGINSSGNHCHDNLFEYNAVERNGTDMTYLYHYHDIYVYGCNNTNRYNVFRHAGGGHCLQHYAESGSDTPCTNNWIYGNVVYGGRAGSTYATDIWGGLLDVVTDPAHPVMTQPGVNYVFNNDFFDSVLVAGGTCWMTNNVILALSGSAPIINSGNWPATIVAGHNYGTNSMLGGSTTVTMAQLGFTNLAKGLFYPVPASVLIGNSDGTVHPPQDWYGNVEASWAEVGPFLSRTDYRTNNLDTASGTAGPDYWLPPMGSCVAPIIASQPTNQTATVGQNVTWYAMATGDAPISFLWYFNGGFETNNATYTAPNVQLSDSGSHITMIASNSCGTVNSSTATLTVVNPGNAPSITTQPRSVIVNVNANANFSIAATGTAPLTYFWKLNGAVVGSNSSTYSKVNCQLPDNGSVVTCIVSNTVGTATSSSATITVNQLPPPTGIYYASPSGSTANTGLDPSSPWPMPYALSHIGQNSTINLLPGVYPSTTWDITSGIDGLTLTNYSTKWSAVLPSVSGNGIFGEIGVSNVTIVGIAVTNCANCGIKFQSCNGWNVRDNWIYKNAEEGILSQHGWNHLIERNLCEWNGTTLGLNHGIYFNGTNSTLRGNVCRYSPGYGIQLYESCNNVKVYDNIIYANHSGLTLWSDGAANYGWNNTVVGNTNYAIIADGGTAYFTNNIAQRTVAGDAIDNADSPTIVEGYNLLNAQSVHAASDVLSSFPNFVNASRGLYWITSGSPAHNAGVNKPPPVDFFGNTQTSITDIGVLQYSSPYATDIRNLELIGSDFWVQLTTPPTGPAITAQPQSANVTVGATALFSLTATGTAPLDYYWKYNGAVVGTNGPAYAKSSCQLTDNGATVMCLVSNSVGTVNSSTVTLTVNAPPTPTPTNTVSITIQGQPTITLQGPIKIQIGK